MTHGWQSESSDGLKRDWSLSLFLSLLLSFSLFLWLSTYLPTDLSIYRSIYLSHSSVCLSIYLSIHLSIYPSIHLSTYPPIHLSIYPSIHLSIHLSIYLSVCLSVYLSIYLSICKLENFAILRDFFIFPSWQHQERSTSARLPHFLKLTTSKTKQFCETSSFFEVDHIKNEASLRDFLIFQSWQHQTTSPTKHFCETSSIFWLDNIKNETILRDFLQKWKVECRADGLVPMRFAIFPVVLSKVLRMPRKSDAKSYEVLHLSRKIISANLKIWCSKMQPLSGNQRPDLLTSLMNMAFVLRLPREMHLCRSSSNVPRLPSLLEMLQNLQVLLTFDKAYNPLRLPRESTSERPKVLRTRQFFALLTSKCASRHNGVHFRHLNFQKWSGAGVFCTFWLANVLRAKTACKFSSLIWPDGSAPADLASLLFDPPEPQIMPTFSRICIFFLLTLSLLWFALFFSSLLSASAHLCFSSVHIVGSLTSKLPSIIFKIIYNKILNIISNIKKTPYSFM